MDILRVVAKELGVHAGGGVSAGDTGLQPRVPATTRRNSGGVRRGDSAAGTGGGAGEAKLGGTRPWGSWRGLRVLVAASVAVATAIFASGAVVSPEAYVAGFGAVAILCGVRIRSCRRRMRASASLMLLAAEARSLTSSSSSSPQLARAASIIAEPGGLAGWVDRRRRINEK